MAPLEHMHLKRVLEIISALEAVLLRSFGPEGGQVLFTRATGQAMLSRSGTRILSAMHLEHPLARMVVECVRNHSTVTGDGAKTFILLLASLLRKIQTTADKEFPTRCMYESVSTTKAASARYLADKLLEFAVKGLADLITADVAPYASCVSDEDFAQLPSHACNPNAGSLLASFFRTRVSYVHCRFMSEITCEMLNRWRLKEDRPSTTIHFLNDNFPSLHTPVPGLPVRSSRLIEGQVIHRDFATTCLPTKQQQPFKAVAFTCDLQPGLLNPGEVLQLEEKNIMYFGAWAEQLLGSTIAKLQSSGVTLIVSSVKQSDVVLALATQAEMSVVECVSKEELSLFAQLSGVTPVQHPGSIQPEHITTLAFCRPILLGAHRYVQVGFCASSEKTELNPCSLVICAPGEEQTDQFVCAIQDSIRMLLTSWEAMQARNTLISLRCSESHKGTAHPHEERTTQIQADGTFEPGLVLPAGGTFEFLLNSALLRPLRDGSGPESKNFPTPVPQILAHALLCVPRLIYSHNPKLFLQIQTRFTNFIHSHPSRQILTGQISCTGDMRSEVFGTDSGFESVACKYQLLLAVLQCATCLLRVDTVMHTRTLLNTQSKKLKSSWDSEEEDDQG